MKILPTAAPIGSHLGATGIVAGLSYFLAHFSGLSDFTAYMFAFVCSAAFALAYSPKHEETSKGLPQRLAQIDFEIRRLEKQVEHLSSVLEELNEDTFNS